MDQQQVPQLPVANVERNLGGHKRTVRSADRGDTVDNSGVHAKTSTTPRAGEDAKRTRNYGGGTDDGLFKDEMHQKTSFSQGSSIMYHGTAPSYAHGHFQMPAAHGMQAPHPQSQYGAAHFPPHAYASHGGIMHVQHHAAAGGHYRHEDMSAFQRSAQYAQPSHFAMQTPPGHVHYQHPYGRGPGIQFPTAQGNGGMGGMAAGPQPTVMYPPAAQAARDDSSQSSRSNVQHTNLSEACSGKKKRPWHRNEDHQLLTVVRRFILQKFKSGDCRPPAEPVEKFSGDENNPYTAKLQWVSIAKEMSVNLQDERNSKQCRERFTNLLAHNRGPVALRMFPAPADQVVPGRPETAVIIELFEPPKGEATPAAARSAQPDPAAATHKHWSQAEDEMLLELQQTHGNKWSIVAKCLQHKNDAQVKNRWYSLQRKASRKGMTVEQVVRAGARKAAAGSAGTNSKESSHAHPPQMTSNGAAAGAGAPPSNMYAPSFSAPPPAQVPAAAGAPPGSSPGSAPAAVQPAHFVPAAVDAEHMYTPMHGPISPQMLPAHTPSDMHMPPRSGGPSDPPLARHDVSSPSQAGDSNEHSSEAMPCGDEDSSPRERTSANSRRHSTPPGSLLPPFAAGDDHDHDHDQTEEDREHQAAQLMLHLSGGGSRGQQGRSSDHYFVPPAPRYAGQDTAAMRRAQMEAAARHSALRQSAAHAPATTNEALTLGGSLSGRVVLASGSGTQESSERSADRSSATGNPSCVQSPRDSQQPSASASVTPSVFSSQNTHSVGDSARFRESSGVSAGLGLNLSLATSHTGGSSFVTVGRSHNGTRLPSLQPAGPGQHPQVLPTSNTSSAGAPSTGRGGASTAPFSSRAGSSTAGFSGRGGTVDLRNSARQMTAGAEHLGVLGGDASSCSGDITLGGGSRPWSKHDTASASEGSELDTARLQSGRQKSPLARSKPPGAPGPGSAVAWQAFDSVGNHTPVRVQSGADGLAAAGPSAPSSIAASVQPAPQPRATNTSTESAATKALASGGGTAPPFDALPQRPSSGMGPRLNPLPHNSRPKSQPTASTPQPVARGMGSSSASSDAGSLSANITAATPAKQSLQPIAMSVSGRIALGASSGGGAAHTPPGGSAKARYMQQRASAGDAHVRNQGGSSSSPAGACSSGDAPTHTASTPAIGRMVGALVGSDSTPNLTVRSAGKSSGGDKKKKKATRSGKGYRNKPTLRKGGVVNLAPAVHQGRQKGALGNTAWGSTNSEVSL